MATIVKTEAEVIGVSILMAAAGGLLLLQGVQHPGPGGGKSDEFGPLADIAANESLGNPAAPGLASGRTPLQIGQFLGVGGLKVSYAGPGRDAYTYLRLVQKMGGVWVTVYGGGLAAVHLGPSTGVQDFPLVAADQPEPPECPAGYYCLYQWPGPAPTPINGAPAQFGAATALLEIYQKASPRDADGYASPTYTARVPVRRTAYHDAILFT